jgi:hypothetical protein
MVLCKTRLQPVQLVSALEAVAARLGIAVRYEVMDRTLSPRQSGGGLCRLRGQPMILLDADLSARERIAILAQALATFDLDGIYLPPLVRSTIRAHGSTHVLEPRPLARAKPPRDGS